MRVLARLVTSRPLDTDPLCVPDNIRSIDPLEFDLILNDDDSLRLRVGNAEEMQVVRTAWAVVVGPHAVNSAELPPIGAPTIDDDLRCNKQ